MYDDTWAGVGENENFKITRIPFYLTKPVYTHIYIYIYIYIYIERERERVRKRKRESV